MKEHLIFKGGTVLKKIWFAEYRFSEDMDFTFDGEGWGKEKIELEFESVCHWIYEESRIKVSLKPEEGSAEQYRAYLSYQGPLGGDKDIKLDISKNELIYYAIQERKVLDAYSDSAKDYIIKVYSLKESLAEKLRCVIQRTISRDIYDLWYLTEEAGLDIEDVAFGFSDKSKYKDKDPLSLIETLEKKKTKYKSNWEISLNHQIKDLPEFDGIYRVLLAEAKKLIALLKS